MIRRLALFTFGTWLLLTPTVGAQICPPCDAEIDIRVEVPLDNRNYSGPTKFEGDVFNAFGKQFSVELLIDNVLKPIVSLSVMNPGKAQFIRWTTPALTLANGPHSMRITIVDLAEPDCAKVVLVPFNVFGNK